MLCFFNAKTTHIVLVVKNIAELLMTSRQAIIDPTSAATQADPQMEDSMAEFLMSIIFDDTFFLVETMVLEYVH